MGEINDKAVIYIKALQNLANAISKIEPVVLGLMIERPDGSKRAEYLTPAEKLAFKIKLQESKQAEVSAWQELKSAVIDQIG